MTRLKNNVLLKVITEKIILQINMKWCAFFQFTNEEAK